MKKIILSIICMQILLVSCKKSADVAPAVTVDATTIDKTKLLALVNATRLAGCVCGTTNMPAVKAVAWNDLLELAAVNHSRDMNQNKYFSHTSQDGRTVGQRITAVNYKWTSLSENIAQGYANEEAVIQGWKNSEGHCKGIMNAGVTEMGVGKSGDYWTQVFAKQ